MENTMALGFVMDGEIPQKCREAARSVIITAKALVDGPRNT